MVKHFESRSALSSHLDEASDAVLDQVVGGGGDGSTAGTASPDLVKDKKGKPALAIIAILIG